MNIMELNMNNYFLKCSICSFPLSVIPIHYNSTLGTICGRCDSIREQYSEETFERQVMFEIIMKHLIFPCAFKGQGCLVEISVDDARLHEQTCIFRVATVLCPLFHEKFYEWCTWIGNYNKLSDHIRNEHKKYFSDSLTFTLTPELGIIVLFSEMKGNLIIVILDKKTDSNSLRCWIMSDMYFKECLENKFQISFHVGDEEHIFEGDKLEYISPSTRISPEYNLVIPLTTLNNLFERYDEISVSISIIPKEKLTLTLNNILEISAIQNKPSEVAELTTRIFHELECPICTELMGTPIYTCIEGHNMCFKCRKKILECPVCRGEILGGRNFTLEKLCSIVTGPCIYRKDGCSFIGTISKVKEHEPFCYIAVRSCIINSCEWHGRTLELPEHIEENHTFRDISKYYSFKLGQKPEQHMFFYDDKIFLMNLFSVEKKSINYSLHCLGGKHLQYDYEIEFLDPSIETNKMIVRDICQPIGYNFNKNSFLLLCIPSQMLSWLIKGSNEIKFRVNMHATSK